MTIDKAINERKKELKEFFEREDIQEALSSKNFKYIYDEWRYRNYILTALFLKSNLNFLQYLKEIPVNCFLGLNIKDISIPDNIIGIGAWAFDECSNLTSITIPNNVTIIDYGAFESCTKLTKITYLGTKDQWQEINKHNNWNNSSSIETICCTNGDINL